MLQMAKSRNGQGSRHVLTTTTGAACGAAFARNLGLGLAARNTWLTNIEQASSCNVKQSHVLCIIIVDLLLPFYWNLVIEVVVRDGVASLPMETIHVDLSAELNGEQDCKVTPCWKHRNIGGHIRSEICVEGIQPRTRVPSSIQEITEQAILALHLLQADLLSLEETDMLGVDKAKGCLPSHVFHKRNGF